MQVKACNCTPAAKPDQFSETRNTSKTEQLSRHSQNLSKVCQLLEFVAYAFGVELIFRCLGFFGALLRAIK